MKYGDHRQSDNCRFFYEFKTKAVYNATALNSYYAGTPGFPQTAK